jgi:hypothetical protein
MLCMDTIAVYSENHTKHKHTVRLEGTVQSRWYIQWPPDMKGVIETAMAHESPCEYLNIRVVQVKHRQGSRNVYNMYLTTATTRQWQHTDGSTRQATGTDHHCLGTCPNAAQVSLYPPHRRTRVAGWATVPLPHEPPHRNWTACPSESSSMAQTRDSHTGRDRGCKGGDPEHPRVSRVAWAACGHALSWSISTPRNSFPGRLFLTIGIVAACVYVSLEQPVYYYSWRHSLQGNIVHEILPGSQPCQSLS